MKNSNFGVVIELVMLVVAWIISTVICKFLVHSSAMIPVFVSFVVSYFVIFTIVYFIRNAMNKKK